MISIVKKLLLSVKNIDVGSEKHNFLMKFCIVTYCRLTSADFSLYRSNSFAARSDIDKINS